jgi:ubiquinone/menaquinone biosynthesis C-methylase UbiE
MAGDGRRRRLDLDRWIDDELLLCTVPGAVDYLFEDLRTFSGAEIRVVARQRDALQVAYRGPLRPLVTVGCFDTAAICLYPDPDRRIRESTEHGVLAALTNDSPRVQFRVGDLGQTRWEVRDRFEADPDWHNSVGDWDVNVVDSPGGLVAEVGELYLTERFGALLRAPASTNPVIGAVMVRLAKIEAGQTVLDPFCGAGTLLVLAGEMAKPGLLIGADIQRNWARAAQTNVRSRGLHGSLLTCDAQRLPLPNFSIDRVIANLPFGKRVGTHRHNTQMYPLALREISRVLTRQGRAVLLTEDNRLFRESVQRTPLLRVIKEIVFERGGAHPSAYVVVKRGNSRAFQR